MGIHPLKMKYGGSQKHQWPTNLPVGEIPHQPVWVKCSTISILCRNIWEKNRISQQQKTKKNTLCCVHHASAHRGHSRWWLPPTTSTTRRMTTPRGQWKSPQSPLPTVSNHMIFLAGWNPCKEDGSAMRRRSNQISFATSKVANKTTNTQTNT